MSEKNGSARELLNEELDKVTGGSGRYLGSRCIMVESDSALETYYKQGDNCSCPDWQPDGPIVRTKSCHTCYFFRIN